MKNEPHSPLEGAVAQRIKQRPFISGQRWKGFEAIGFKFDIKLINAEPEGIVESVLPGRAWSNRLIK